MAPRPRMTLEAVQAALPLLENAYKKNGDPLYAWIAIRACNEAGVITLPSWVRDYLGRGAQALADITAAAEPTGGRNRLSEAEVAGKALGFGTGVGRGTTFSRKAKANCDARIHAASATKKHSEIVKEFGVGPDVPKDACQKWREIERQIQQAIKRKFTPKL